MALGYEVADGIATITFERPDVLNAFDDELGHAVLAAVTKASDDDSVRCIVLTGAGRAFSSGEDLGALAEGYARGETAPLGNVLVDRYNPLIRAITSAPKPVLAALNGVAAGAGASIALACDFRSASDKAKLVLAFIKVGLVPDSGGIWFLTKMVGAAKAWELCALGEPLSAEQALELHLVNRVVPAGEFDDAWRSFAVKLSSGPTRAFALTKRLQRAALEGSLDEQLDLEGELQAEAGGSRDHLEGVQAFLAKRAPEFEGR
ncbi:MAG: enoyl-CoA hydratase-related protein [Actinomycetota bacterium]